MSFTMFTKLSITLSSVSCLLISVIILSNGTGLLTSPFYLGLTLLDVSQHRLTLTHKLTRCDKGWQAS